MFLDTACIKMKTLCGLGLHAPTTWHWSCTLDYTVCRGGLGPTEPEWVFNILIIDMSWRVDEGGGRDS